MVGTNDDIGERCAVLENEDCVVRAGVFVTVASSSTVELLVAHVFASRDRAGGGERNYATNTSRDVEGLGGAHTGQNGGKDGSLKLHFEDCLKE